MSLAAVARKTWRENRLFSVLVELTYRCNLHCVFCYNDVTLRGRMLSLDDYRRLLADLERMGVFQVVLSGGEPLAHPEFFAIGVEARAKGFVVRVKSNGHALKREVAHRLRTEVDPFFVELSLHGATAATHERQTRVPGSFETLLVNLADAQEEGLRLRLNSTLTCWNEGEVERMFALADGLGIPLSFDPDLSIRDNGDRSPLALAPSPEGLRGLFRVLRERAGAAREAAEREALRPAADDGLPAPSDGKHCGAGSSTAAIDPYGNVYPCVAWRVPSGNLHDSSIEEIWRGSAALAEVRATTLEIPSRLAQQRGGAETSGFCPGTSWAQTGSPFELPPGVVARREAVDEVFRTGPLLPVLPPPRSGPASTPGETA